MGTYYHVTAYGNENTMSSTEVKKMVEAELVKMNLIFSTYDKNSDISKFNESEPGTWTKLNKDFDVVFKLADRINNESVGAFDVSVGALVNRWGFGPIKYDKKPTKEEVELIKKDIGFDKIETKNQKYKRLNKNVFLDFSAIAKGYGVDHILSLLQKNKFESALVEIGGEVRGFGVKPDGRFWKIGIEKPSDRPAQSSVQQIVALSDMAMATSGSYRNYRRFGNEVFSHTMDPRTGYPVKHSLISVSVVTTTCAEADAYATALMVLGPKDGYEFATKMNLAAYFLSLHDGEIKINQTDSFTKYMNSVKKEK